MKAIDIDRLIQVGRPSLASDGSFAVFATSRPDIAANRAVGQLWRIALPGGTPQRLTRGVADSQPRVHPENTSVAFLRADADGVTQIFVLPLDGGEAMQATRADAGVLEFAWSPDGSRLAFTARVVEPGRYGSVDGLDAEHESPRRITGLRWHANGLGYIADRPSHLFIVDAPDFSAEPPVSRAPAPADGDAEKTTDAEVDAAPAATRLTFGDAAHSGVRFSPDGGELFTVVSEIERDRPDLRNSVIAVRTDARGTDACGTREVVPRSAGLAIEDLVSLGDGRLVLAASAPTDGVDFIAPDVALRIWDGTSAAVLTDPDTLDLGEPGGSLVVSDGAAYVRVRARGRLTLARVDLDDGAVTEVIGGDVEVGGHDVAAGVIVASVATATSLGELAVVGTGVVTEFGAEIAQRDLASPTEHVYPARDGYPVHGWVATPSGEGPFPVILQIHGGPYASYGIHLFDETQVLVDAGYAVVYSNPRGSAGYGREHGRSIRHAMGTVDFVDVIDFLDAAIAADPRLDGERVGVMGGSYGGYLTAWIIAHDHRFAGAIVERGFLDPVSFQGTSDIGAFFGDQYVGTDPDQIAAQSPMAVVGQVRTPTLVVHSELDYRCPLEQATRYYSALRRGGVPAEMVIFPGENHELTRAGQPRHRVERFDIITEWWRRVLPPRP